MQCTHCSIAFRDIWHRNLGGKASARNWETWASLYNWRERGLASDSDHASRRRIRRGDALERAQDDIANMSRAALVKLGNYILVYQTCLNSRPFRGTLIS